MRLRGRGLRRRAGAVDRRGLHRRQGYARPADTRLGLAHPGYGFERHMGYSVPEHFAALAKLGPTIHHRRSFAPVAAKLADLEGGASDEVVAELLPL